MNFTREEECMKPSHRRMNTAGQPHTTLLNPTIHWIWKRWKVTLFQIFKRKIHSIIFSHFLTKEKVKKIKVFFIIKIT
jgi:hypothetical protein